MSNMDSKYFMSRVELELKRQGIGKMQFYKDVGVSDAAASNWRRGKTFPTLGNIARICEYLGVDESALVRPLNSEPPVQTAPDKVDEVETYDNLIELLDVLRSREDMRMLFKLAKNASPEDVRQAVKIIEALRDR